MVAFILHVSGVSRHVNRGLTSWLTYLRTFAAPPSAPEGISHRLSPECESVGDGGRTDRPRGGGAPTTWLAGT